MSDLIIADEIRVPVHDMCVDDEESMLDILQKKGVEVSFQCSGEVDEKGCKIMELLPVGNWLFYRDIERNEYVFSRNTSW